MKRCLLVTILCLLSCNNIYGAEITKPEVRAMGAVLMDAKTGRILWGKNEELPLAMASTTKIMTAVLTLENKDLNTMVTVSKRASAAPKVKMYLKAGEEIKLEYLLYALMLQSSNDAAVAIAECVAGSVEDFCAMMTAKAREIGAKDTIFETPNGLDGTNHHSTAKDLALIAQYALNNPEFVKIINTPYVECKSSRMHYSISNRNRLLREYPGANGIKTGFTGKAGHCFVGAAIRDDMQLISVVLASGWGNEGKEQKWRDTKKILDFGFGNYKYHTIVSTDETPKRVYINRSKTDTVELYYEEGLLLPLNKQEKENIFIDINAPTAILAPVEKGQQIGMAKIYINGQLEKEILMLASTDAERHDLKTSLEKVLNEWLELGTNTEMKITLPEF